MSFVITFDGFQGANTFIDAMELPSSVCTESVDQEPSTGGDLRPRLDVGPVVRAIGTLLAPKTIWRIGQAVKSESDYWLSFTNRVDLARGFESSDPTERTYYTGDGVPKYTNSTLALTGGAPYPQGWRPLGVPGPTAALAVTVAVDGPSGGTEAVNAFVYTFVSQLGWESAPSPPSNQPLAKPGATFNLTGFEAPPGGYDIEIIRVYKGVYDGAGGFEYFFFREWLTGDPTPANPIGDARAISTDPLSTEGYRPPPADGFGLTRLWAGMLAMLSGKAMRICVPYLHYAWPLRYEIGLADDPVAIGVWGQRGIVLTKGDAVLFAGADPDAMDDEPATINRPCSSAASVVSFNEGMETRGVMWASEKGLCWYGDGGFQLTTERLLLVEEWEAMNPASMVATQHEGRYVCSYLDGEGVRRGFMVDPKSPTGLHFMSSGFDAAFRDPISDSVFVLQGKDIKRWAAGAVLPARAKSKLFKLPRPDNIGAIEVIARGYPVTVTVWGDGVQRHSQVINSPDPIKPPSGWRADKVQFQVQSSSRVLALRAGPNVESLKR